MPSYIINTGRFLEFTGVYFIDIINLQEYFNDSELTVEDGEIFFKAM